MNSFIKAKFTKLGELEHSTQFLFEKMFRFLRYRGMLHTFLTCIVARMQNLGVLRYTQEHFELKKIYFYAAYTCK